MFFRATTYRFNMQERGNRVLVKILAPTINKILSAIPFQIMEDLNWETILMGVFLTFTFAQHILITVHADCKL